jgi:hypothetical protein
VRKREGLGDPLMDRATALRVERAGLNRRTAMKSAVRIASVAALLLTCLPAQAYEQEQDKDAVKVQVGSALVCDTQQQVERFVALYDGDVATTLTVVNGEQAKNGEQAAKHACDVATIAYVMGPEVSQARSTNGNGTFRVVRVLVLGVLTDKGLQASVPTPFYSAAKVEEQEA